jgi:hypothetical protein
MSTISSTALEHVIGVEGLVALQLRGGTLRLRGTDGDAVRVSDADGADLEDDFDVERGEGSFAMRHHKGLEVRLGRRGSEGSARLEVELPRRATLVVETARADLSGDELAGSQRYRTVSGDVRLTRAGGRIAVDAVSGDVSLSAAASVRLTVRTVSGDVGVRAARLDEAVLTTTSGDIALAGELAPDGQHRIETVSGDTLLALTGGTRVEVSTVTGDVTADVPHRSEGGRGRKVLIIGNGRATLAAHSMSGDVTLVAARPDEAGAGNGTHPDPADPDTVPAEPELSEADPSAAAISAAYDEARLRVLQGLERGEFDVAEATRRLEALDTADATGGPGHDR